MALKRTVEAWCDHFDIDANTRCETMIFLDPDSTQPFRELADHNWWSGFLAGCPDYLVLCPAHKPYRSS